MSYMHSSLSSKMSGGSTCHPVDRQQPCLIMTWLTPNYYQVGFSVEHSALRPRQRTFCLLDMCPDIVAGTSIDIEIVWPPGQKLTYT